MTWIKAFLFPQNTQERSYSLFILAMRILFGVLLMSHGIQKLNNYSALAGGAFPDPLGIGSEASVVLAIFGEVLCSAAFIAGFLYRLSMIPMIVTMIVAFFAVHSGDVSGGELAFVYLLVFIIMYIAGPGRYSIDRIIAKRLYSKNNTSKYNTTTWRRN